MKRQTKFRADNKRAGSEMGLLPFDLSERVKPERRLTELTAKNPRQKQYLNSMSANTVTFGLGPAGTGKTFLSAWTAADAFDKGDYERLIITRPAVEAGENLGFLPGELEDKIDPYFVPVREAIQKRLGKGSTEYHMKKGTILFVPLAYMRGRTFDDAFVIADEMQNATPAQMKMFLTRIGDRCKYVVNGDLNQSDIPGPNGLKDAVGRFAGARGCGTTVFTRDDVVRSGQAQVFVDGYEGDGADKLPAFLARLAER
jgi:phosphate starvation-inducible PhoH-like protein